MAADVSIIIPTYNRRERLLRAIESIQAQDGGEVEIIVVDDGSTDGSAEAVEALDDPRIRLIRSSNQGAAAARNTGVEAATSDLVTFLDSDDEVLEGWLGAMLDGLRTSEADMVCCGCASIHEGAAEPHLVKMPREQSPACSGVRGLFTNAGVYMLPRSLFLEVGGFDAQLRCGQHSELALRMFAAINRNVPSVHCIEQVLVRINIHKGARIRTDVNALLGGAERTLWKHDWMRHVDPKRYANHCAVAGVAAARLGMRHRARSHFLDGARVQPGGMNTLRFAATFLPGLPWGEGATLLGKLRKRIIHG